MNKKVTSLKGIEKVRVNDGTWEVSYGTTAEFDFCPCCGDFGNHLMEDGTYECGEFQTISEEELIEKINKFVETDDEFIEYKGGK